MDEDPNWQKRMDANDNYDSQKQKGMDRAARAVDQHTRRLRN